jgi:peptidoglycan/LPS O-acetylase OafA/YrhL
LGGRGSTEAARRGTSNKYRPDVDGLRAVAVLPVVIFHAFPETIPGGFLGVDIFFVISGFLITGILRDELAAGRFSILGFYERRVRRIFPALFTVLAATTLLAVAVMMPVDLREYFDTLLGATLFSSNFVFWQQSGYFDTAAELKPLLHTWSLAVEEQFYIFFPPLLWLAWRFRLAAAMAWLGLIGSFAFAILALRNHADLAYYLIPSRAWELMIGAIIALGAVPDLSKLGRAEGAIRQVIAVLGLALIVIGFFTVDEFSKVPGFPALLPCVGAAALIYAGTGAARPTWPARLLSLKPFVFVGLISYSLYLWHWPLLALARYVNIDVLSTSQATAAVIAAFLCAWLSWRYVERPFRRGAHHHAAEPAARRQGSRRAVLAGVTVIAVFVVLGAIGSLGLRSQATIARFYGDDVMAVLGQLGRRVSPPYCVGSVEAGTEARCRIGDPSKPVAMALWGDSIADSIAGALADVDPEHSAYRFIEHSCPPILGATRVDRRPAWITIRERCRTFNERVIAEIERRPEIGTVVIVGIFGVIAKLEPDGVITTIPDGFEKGMSSAAMREMLVDRLVETAQRIAALGKTVVILGAYQTGDKLSAATEARRMMTDDDARARFGTPLVEFEAMTEIVNARFRALPEDPRIIFVDPKLVFCDPKGSNWCHYDQGLPLISDGTHFTDFGAKRIATAIRFAISERRGIVTTP